MPPEVPRRRGDQKESGTDLGTRIRRFRGERGLNLSQLAQRAQVSKGYLSALENDPEARRPSAETLYALAKALGVTIADLMGRNVRPTATDIPDSLREFAEEQDLPEADVQMLASIQFRGEQPRTKDRWRFIYTAIRTSTDMDRPPL